MLKVCHNSSMFLLICWFLGLFRIAVERGRANGQQAKSKFSAQCFAGSCWAGGASIFPGPPIQTSSKWTNTCTTQTLQ